MTPSAGEVKRNSGRRTADFLRQKSAWILIVGLLVQGGFVALNRQLLALGEDQLNRERALLVEQHTELLQGVDRLALRLEALEARALELAEAAATVRGIALNRYRCPDLTCQKCARCPDVAAGPIIVTAPASVLPPPSKEAPGLPTRPRRTP